MQTGQLEAIKNEKFVHLTTIGRKSGKAHTVELWFALEDGMVYLSHEGSLTDWMRNIEERGRVEARIGKLKFEADARIVGSGEPREKGKHALYEKYYGPATKAVIDDWFSLSKVVQMKPL